MVRKLVLAAAIVASAAAPIGCAQPEDMVKVDVPRDVQQRTGAPPTVTLTQFRDIKAEYEAKVQEEAEANAAKAAATARALTRSSRAVQGRYADQIAALQRQATAEIESLEGDAAERQEQLEAASLSIARAFDATRKRMQELDAQAQAKADNLRSLVNFGLNEVAPTIASQVPGAGIALPILTGLVGLWMKRPGDAAKHAREIKEVADRAYDDGAKEARLAMLTPMTRQEKTPTP